MNTIWGKLSHQFEKITSVLITHKWKTLILQLILIAVIFSQLPKLRVDTSTEGFLDPNDPAIVNYYNFRDQFGRDEMIVIAIKTDNIFNKAFLKKLRELHFDIKKNVPYIDDMTSLINARNTRGDADSLIVEDLYENWPVTDFDYERIKRLAIANPIYKDLIISQDLHYTTIVIQTQNYAVEESNKGDFSGFSNDETVTQSDAKNNQKPPYLTDEQNSEMVTAVSKILDKYKSENFQIYVTGIPVIAHILKVAMTEDVQKSMGMLLLAIITFLFITFRRISAVFLPIVVVVISLMSTIALMAGFGTAMKLPTQILPCFLLVVCIGDTVHVLTIFYRRLSQTGNKNDSIIFAMQHSGVPILMTSVTTAAGLISFCTAKIAPVADLGIFAGLGVMLALFYTVTLLPVMLTVLPIKSKKGNKVNKEGTILDRVFAAVTDVSCKHPYKIFTVASVLFVISLLGIIRIHFSHNVMKWFQDDSPILEATRAIDKAFKGSINMEIVLDTGRPNGLYDPVLLKKLEKSILYIQKLKYDDMAIGKALAVTDIIKEINAALNENRPGFYAIPNDEKLISQELMLFENSGSDDLEDFIDHQFSKARITVSVPFLDAIVYDNFINEVNEHFRVSYPEAEFKITGMIALMFQTITNTIRSLATSYYMAVVIITFLMVILIGRIRIGLLSMIPNLLPIFLMLGIMGWLDIPMDLFIMPAGSIALGLVVDDTIHFIYHFKRNFEQRENAPKAIYETMNSTGRAMIATSMILSIGFFMYLFGTMKNHYNFGLLTGVTIILALFADFFLCSALLFVFNKKSGKETAQTSVEEFAREEIFR